MTEPLRAPSLLTRDYAIEPPPQRRRVWPWLLGVLLFLAALPPAAVLVLRWVPPPTTAFMLQSPVKPVQYRWVPAGQLPDHLRRAVVAAEDQKFWSHRGFDFEAIEQAIEHNRRSQRLRGASTISQQVAKNLFLWPSRSYLRKGLEVTFTVLLELLWPKDRILEVYLNIAEFGPGVYGAEAAAQKFFRKPAAELSPVEGAQLAAVLPNPRKWRAASPGPYVQKRTDWILGQLGYEPSFSFEAEVLEPLPADPMPAEPALEAPAPGANGGIVTQPVPETSVPEPEDGSEPWPEDYGESEYDEEAPADGEGVYEEEAPAEPTETGPGDSDAEEPPAS